MAGYKDSRRKTDSSSKLSMLRDSTFLKIAVAVFDIAIHKRRGEKGREGKGLMMEHSFRVVGSGPKPR